MSKSEYRAYNFAAQEPSKEPSKGSTDEKFDQKLKDEIDKKIKEEKALDKRFLNPKYDVEWEKEW